VSPEPPDETFGLTGSRVPHRATPLPPILCILLEFLHCVVATMSAEFKFEASEIEALKKEFASFDTSGDGRYCWVSDAALPSLPFLGITACTACRKQTP
jgi:hypothetical protein